MGKIETPEALLKKLLGFHVVYEAEEEHYEADLTDAQMVALLASRDALVRADERQKAAEKAVKWLNDDTVGCSNDSLRAAIMAEPEEAQG